MQGDGFGDGRIEDGTGMAAVPVYGGEGGVEFGCGKEAGEGRVVEEEDVDVGVVDGGAVAAPGCAFVGGGEETAEAGDAVGVAAADAHE